MYSRSVRHICMVNYKKYVILYITLQWYVTYRSEIIGINLSIQEPLEIFYIVKSCTHSYDLNVFWNS